MSRVANWTRSYSSLAGYIDCKSWVVHHPTLPLTLVQGAAHACLMYDAVMSAGLYPSNAVPFIEVSGRVLLWCEAGRRGAYARIVGPW